MAAEDTHDSVQRFQFATHDEAEAEAFIQGTYVGNRTQFLARRDGRGLSVSGAAAGEVTTDHLLSTVDYRADCEPFDYFFSFAVRHGQLRIRTNRIFHSTSRSACSAV